MNSFKQQCIALRKKDHTINEIMRITGRSKSSIYAHICSIPLSDKKKQEISENSRQLALRVADSRRGKALRPIKEFHTWTPELVLLTGHLIFDGELKKSCVYNNRSTALITRVKKLMRIVYDFEPKLYFNSTTGVHRICYHNVELSTMFKTRSQELRVTIINFPLEFQREFLRAFFDDEGCMDFRKQRNIRQVRGYQKDRSILILVQQLLTQFDIQSALKGKNEVVIRKKENLKKFQQEINFSPGVRINPNRTNSIWKKDLEKRVLLDMAIKSFTH